MQASRIPPSAFEAIITVRGQQKRIQDVFDKYYNSIFNKLDKHKVKSIKPDNVEYTFHFADEEAPLDGKFQISTQKVGLDVPIFSSKIFLSHPFRIRSFHTEWGYKHCKTNTETDFDMMLNGFKTLGKVYQEKITARGAELPDGSEFITKYIKKYKPIQIFHTKYKKEIIRMTYNSASIYVLLHSDHYIYVQLLIRNISLTPMDKSEIEFEFNIFYIPFDNFNPALNQSHILLLKHPFLELELQPVFQVYGVPAQANNGNLAAPQPISDGINRHTKDVDKIPARVVWNKIYDARIYEYQLALSYLSKNNTLNKDTVKKISENVSFKDKYTNAQMKTFLEEFIAEYQTIPRSSSRSPSRSPNFSSSSASESSPKSPAKSPKSSPKSPAKSSPKSPKSPVKSSPKLSPKSPAKLSPKLSPKSPAKSSPKSPKSSPKSPAKLSPKSPKSSPKSSER
jgi:hypothetical protein